MPAKEWWGYTIRYELTKDLLSGCGIEIGPGHSPQKLPVGVEAVCFDKRDAASLSQAMDDAIDFPIYPMADIAKYFPHGADFLIAHNVLEHTADPIGTLVSWHKHVRPGGLIVLSMPDQRFANFEQGRLTTPFGHLVLDYLMQRTELSYESSQHLYSFVLAWDRALKKHSPWRVHGRNGLVEILLESVQGTEPDGHWHSLDRFGWERVICAASVFGHHGIANVRTIDQESTGPWVPAGEVIFVYRRTASGVEGFPGVSIELVEIRGRLQDAACQIGEALTMPTLNPEVSPEVENSPARQGLPVTPVSVCVLCGNDTSTLVYAKPDAVFEGGQLFLRRCTNCGLVFLNPRLSEAASAQLENDSAVYAVDAEVAERNIELLKPMIRNFEPFTSKRRRLLDIGCNRGWLLEAARQIGWEVVGVEPSSAPAEFARSNYGLDVRSSLADVSGQFDLIFAWHVLEHTPDPVSFLFAAARRLSREGAMAIQVPSFERFDKFVESDNLTGLVCAVHTYYFGEPTMRAAFAAAGLDPVMLTTNDSDHFLTAVGRRVPTESVPLRSKHFFSV